MRMDPLTPFASATDIARAVTDGEVTAAEVTTAMLNRVNAENVSINAFTDVLAERAMREAHAVDQTRSQGKPLGPLAGVPYAVKNLFDLKGEVTRAGSIINLKNQPASQDADLVDRLRQAGAVCLGALSMGEFAYDFTGENLHYGACRNPHDLVRMTGGSSSGSGAATAAGLAPISLGSDTNGSLRVPASLCGVFSLKPTYGRLSRGGTFPFVDSLDHVGPLARSVSDLALAYNVLQGSTSRDHACRPDNVMQISAPVRKDISQLRIGVLRGWFEDNSTDEALERRDMVLKTLSAETRIVDVTLDQAAIGRAAAYIITNAESSAFHFRTLQNQADDYDPDTRDRFLAGALLPAPWVAKAQRVRHWWLNEALDAFRKCDVMLAPATPCSAPLIGQKTLNLNGKESPLRPVLGLLAQPFSCIGLPVVTVPAYSGNSMPLGMQLISPPWREDISLQVAAFLEMSGAVNCSRPASTVIV